VTWLMRGYGLSFDAPALASVNLWALALALAAMIAVFRFKAGMLPTLAASSIAGVLLYAAGVSL
jgi:chromate transporter